MLAQIDIHGNITGSHPLGEGGLHRSYIPLPAYVHKACGDCFPVSEYDDQPHYIQFAAA